MSLKKGKMEDIAELPASELHKIIDDPQNKDDLKVYNDADLRLILKKISYKFSSKGHKKFAVGIEGNETVEGRLLARELFKFHLAQKIFIFSQEYHLTDEEEDRLLSFLDEDDFEHTYNQLSESIKKMGFGHNIFDSFVLSIRSYIVGMGKLLSKFKNGILRFLKGKLVFFKDTKSSAHTPYMYQAPVVSSA